MAAINIFDSDNDLARGVAKASALVLKEAIHQYGYAVWVLCGGTTPTKSYKELALKYKDYLDWQKVYFIMGDERSVGIGDQQSNWQQAKEALDGLGYKKEKVILPSYSLDNKADAKDYSNKLNELFNKLGSKRIDLTWLGIGDDGHTLSLFPGDEQINNSNELVLVVNNSPKPPPRRISLSLAVLGNSKTCYCLASGDSKRAIFSEIKTANDQLPIVRVIKYLESQSSQVSWFIDQAVLH